MKRFIFYTLLLCSWSTVSAQNIQFISESAIELEVASSINLPGSTYQTLSIPFDELQDHLRQTPKEHKVGLKNSPKEVMLPLPNGTFHLFKVIESSVLQPADQARWPQLRTYRILDTENALYQGRMTVTPNGVTAHFNSAAGAVIIEPYASGQNDYHIAYYTKDADNLALDMLPLSCGYEGFSSPDKFENTIVNPVGGAEKTSASTIKEYILALTCTGEYAAQKGGTIASVLASFVEAINIANSVFEQEVGVRMTLIGSVEQLIYLNAAGDPFVEADFGEGLLSQVRDAITGQGFSFSSYDLGHVFTGGCTDVGGIVGGNACSAGKDEGVTCHSSNNSLAGVILNIFTHEIAHQYGVGHTFSNCTGNNGQLASGSAFEPGSGTTIMSYQGACDDQDVQGDIGSNFYYHGYSLEEFVKSITETNGAICVTHIPTDNTAPKLTLDYTNGFYIPIATPFELMASAEDEQDDPLTYCWEQMNLDPSVSPMGSPTGNAPTFRSYPPTTASNRVFPRLPMLVNNQSELWEVLPTYSRDLDFRCTVRDNNAEIGDIAQQDVAFKSTATAGPFVVTTPNTANETWSVGEYREVRWEVANTNNDLVDCQLVNIRLSADGGFTYPHTLLSESPNNGSAFVFVPDVVGNNMRIRVEAADNIFFDISNANFSISAATIPTYTFNLSSVYQEVCLPNTAVFEIETASVLGYNESLNLELLSELPEGVSAAFSTNNIQPEESATLTVDMNNLVDYNGPLEIQFSVTAAGQETLVQSLYFDIIDNDMSDLALLTPAAGQAEVGFETDFSWSAIYNAQSYDWELSDEPDFSNILDSRYGITETTLSPTIQFPSSTLFYWRVRGINDCGAGEWQTPRVFHTINTACSPLAPNDLPIQIPGTGPLPTITSDIFVPFSGEITDINIPFLRVRYQPIQNFYVSLTSPSGTVVRLYDSSCFGTDEVRVGFDDEASEELICPPDNAFLYRPAEPLSTFDGEDSEGVWRLTVKILETGFGASGQLAEWGLEFCATGTPVSPTVMRNDTLFVPPAMSNTITTDLLNVTDGVQSASELKYSLVTLPKHGILYKAEQELGLGANFTQNTINSFNLTYLNTNEEEVYDSFDFVVEDGEGGFIPVQRFNIKMTDGAVVKTDLVEEKQSFTIYPNPATEGVSIYFEEGIATRLPLKVLDINGRLLLQDQLAAGTVNYQLDAKGWPAGMYLIQLGGETQRLIKK